MGIWQRLKCRMGWHPRLDIIQTFGAAQHIGCPYCGKELAIHHGVRAVVPWDSEFAEMYQRFGHDTDAETAKWQAYRRAAGFVCE